MTHRPILLLLVVTSTLAIALGVSPIVHASDPAMDAPDKARPTQFRSDVPFPHIRSPEPQMRALIADAIDRSATVRALVARITASDVVVFVACEDDPGVKPSGRLNFMTSAGGVRYVVIRLKPKRRAAAIAMLAHELQHAAEIADTPAIVDDASLAREYARIGYRSHPAAHGLAFDTQAAVDVGRRVVEELMVVKSSAGD